MANRDHRGTITLADTPGTPPTTEPTPSATGQAPSGSTPPGGTPPTQQLPSPQINLPPDGSRDRPDLLGALNPTSKGAGAYRVDPRLLKPAEDGAFQVARFLETLARSLEIGAPPGTYGFATNFQMGLLAVDWRAELAEVSRMAQATGDKILRTRCAYEAAERENDKLFTLNG
ncbi:hypothetical protein [Yinghuangia soli]|uniref:Uncharacterized protein n=1 Tax=Yinghuangia soli TaxID=2908204 RepID=A0AA41Q5C3_9ACTN|nr:hypothetical protein [Yinghuangia soli]MCF2530946.1 hypothetical protein [Yinghuangia soli]